MSKSVYEIVTDRIIELIKTDKLNWRKTWKLRDWPQSYVRGKRYTGINVLTTQWSGFGSPYWLTWKDVEHLKGSIKKGARGTPIVFYKPKEYTVTVKEKDEETGEEKEVVKVKPGWILRYFLVWNLEQTTGIPDKAPPRDIPTIASGEELMKNLPEQPKMMGGEPAYSPTLDVIFMPPRSNFDTSGDYYATLFHETVHWTGHDSRLNRHTERTVFGSGTYSKEELVAELGAAFLCALTGIEPEVKTEHAAYIKGWLVPLENDPKFVFEASRKAMGAVEYCIKTKKDLREVVPAGEPGKVEATA